MMIFSFVLKFRTKLAIPEVIIPQLAKFTLINKIMKIKTKIILILEK